MGCAAVHGVTKDWVTEQWTTATSIFVSQGASFGRESKFNPLTPISLWVSTLGDFWAILPKVTLGAHAFSAAWENSWISFLHSAILGKTPLKQSD